MEKKGTDWKTGLLLSVLAFTSFSSLIYELVWSRELSHVFGTGALATSTVLSVFLAGLAFGSLYGGRFIDKHKSKYRFLAYLELLIGISCLITLYLFRLIKYPYLSIHNLLGDINFLFNVSQFILSFVILIVPTFLIGVALPTIVKLYHHEHKKMGKSVGDCYMADTVGGALGIVLAGFFLIWLVGFFKVSVMASTVNILLGILLLVLLGDEAYTEDSYNPKIKVHGDNRVLVLFFFSGFAALTLENVWIRFFDLIFGNSIISFSTVVAAFLLSLGIGSLLSKKMMERFEDRIVLFSSIELLIGISSLVILLVFPYLEQVFLKIFFGISEYYLFLFLLGVISFSVLTVPTILMGMTFPVLSTIYVDRKRIGADVGKLFSVNSFGSIVGSFFTGFVFVYFLGLNNTAIFAAVIYISISMAFVLLFAKESLKKLLYLLIPAGIVIIILFSAFYQPHYLFTGVYYHGTRYDDESVYFEYKRGYTPLFLKHSYFSLISVLSDEDDEYRYLRINGRSEASTWEITQDMLAHLPLLVHKDPKEVLNIGHGGGFTLNSLRKYPEVELIETIEIDPVIIEANEYLKEHNEDPLSDPKVRLIIADARNYLFSSEKKYDVIISEPSHLWASSSLFTKESFELVKEHLDENGIYTIWLPYYEMSDYDYGVMIKTIESVFPHITEFDVRSDIIILASEYKINIPDDIVLERLNNPVISRELDQIRRIEGRTDLSNYEFIVDIHYSGDIDKYILDNVGDIEEIHTDDLPILEITTLRNRYDKFRKGYAHSFG